MFLTNKAIKADALYILGDLFEMWIGEDYAKSLHQRVFVALSNLIKGGVPCYFIRGNHDFLLSDKFIHQIGIQLLPTETVINLYNQKLLIMHGDTLCASSGYQFFRRQVSKKWLQKIFLNLPLFIRKNIATITLSISRKINQKNKKKINIDQRIIDKIMNSYHIYQLIHGHIHHQAIYNEYMNDIPTKRISLGFWNKEGSVLVITPKSIRFIRFPFDL